MCVCFCAVLSSSVRYCLFIPGVRGPVLAAAPPPPGGCAAVPTVLRGVLGGFWGCLGVFWGWFGDDLFLVWAWLGLVLVMVWALFWDSLENSCLFVKTQN